MAYFLVLIGFIVAFPGAVGPGLLFLLPRLNPAVWHRLGFRRTALVGAGVILIICGLLLDASLRWPILLIPVLIGLRIFLRPDRVIQALDVPRHLSVDQADLAPDDYVLAVEVDGEPRAWFVDVVIAHHLIHDKLGKLPVLASW